jgi:hypothetical protein
MIDLATAARTTSLAAAAYAYLRAGVNVLPLSGKRAVIGWSHLQRRSSSAEDVQAWQARGLLKNIGIICGETSNNLTAIDLDGLNAVVTYREAFPLLMSTFTVRSGSGKGLHLYYQVEELLPTSRSLNIRGGGNIELRASGTYIVAPPSLHPDTKARYTVQNAAPVMRIRSLDIVREWLETLTPKVKAEDRQAGHGRAIRREAYAAAALERELRAVETTPPGGRNDRLNLAAYSLGQLIGDGLLTRYEVENALLVAASPHFGKDSGTKPNGQKTRIFNQREAVATIRSGIEAGMRNPRSRRRG